MSYQKIIIRPLFTEKMSRLEEEEQKYAFQVMKGVYKIEIKRAIEEKFEIEVENVATMNCLGKEKNINAKNEKVTEIDLSEYL